MLRSSFSGLLKGTSTRRLDWTAPRRVQKRNIFFLAFPPLIIGGIVVFGVAGIALNVYNKRQRQLYQEKLNREQKNSAPAKSNSVALTPRENAERYKK